MVPNHQWICLSTYTLEKYGSATLHVTLNGTHVELSENPYSYVLCAVDTLSNSEFRDSTAAIVNTKYHSHLSELYGLLLNSFEDELSLLQDIARITKIYYRQRLWFVKNNQLLMCKYFLQRISHSGIT
jgi:hypothetical protein